MNSIFIPIVLWWEGRELRERLLLTVLLAVLLVSLIVVTVWRPLQSARISLADEITRQEHALYILQAQPATTLSVSVNDERPLATVVTESVAAFQLTIRRLEPEGSSVRVVLEDASFDSVIFWLEAVQRDSGLRVNEMEISRRPAPGVVNAVVSLER